MLLVSPSVLEVKVLCLKLLLSRSSVSFLLSISHNGKPNELVLFCLFVFVIDVFVVFHIYFCLIYQHFIASLYFFSVAFNFMKFESKLMT